MAENYLQHAEHYNRIIMAAQPQNPQPIAHNGSEAGHALNGVHRGHRDGNGTMREQPQPHINGEAMDVQPQPQPRMQPVVTEQPMRAEQPIPNEQPVIEGDMFPETKQRAAPVSAAPVADGASPEGDTGRRRRRRYPSGTATREAGAEGEQPVATEKPEKPAKAAKAAPTEEQQQPTDEATA